MKKKVLVYGAGRLGRALGGILEKKGISVDYWDKMPNVVPDQKSLKEIAPQADVVLVAIPSWFLREAISELSQHLKPEALVVAFSKGLEKGTNLSVPRLYQELLPSGQSFAMCCGPMIYSELSDGQFGAGTIGSTDRKSFELLNELYQGTNLKLNHSSDVDGVALAGVLKNIYAMGLGISLGLGYKENVKGYLTSVAMQEIKQILETFGHQADLVFGWPALGDFITTSGCKDSTNRTLGRQLARNEEISRQSEGFVSIESMKALLSGKGLKTSFLDALYGIVTEGSRPEEVYKELLNIA